MVEIKSHAGIYTLTSRQELPIPIDEAWQFFSSPANLSKITPKDMGFQITSGDVKQMHAGQVITYKIGLLPGITTNWVTEITHVQNCKYFVDEQRFGPYKMWHHEHLFEKSERGVLMTDKVSYKMPFGIFGRIAHALFVRAKLEKIFSFRIKILDDQFN